MWEALPEMLVQIQAIGQNGFIEQHQDYHWSTYALSSELLFRRKPPFRIDLPSWLRNERRKSEPIEELVLLEVGERQYEEFIEIIQIG